MRQDEKRQDYEKTRKCGQRLKESRQEEKRMRQRRMYQNQTQRE